MSKPNPILQAFQRKLEIEHTKDLEALSQMGLISAMVAYDDSEKLTPERAERFLRAYRSKLLEISKLFKDDSKDDSELVYSKAVLRRRLSQILSESGFERNGYLFSILKEE